MTHDQVFLSPRDKGRFEEDGYSVLNGFLNLEEAQTCRILINRALDPSETDLESEQIDRLQARKSRRSCASGWRHGTCGWSRGRTT